MTQPEVLAVSTARRFSLQEGQFIQGTPYRIVRAIDLGGMGEVYEVDHTRAGTRRVIKVVRDLSDPRARAADRLRQEARALRAVNHPNVVRVFELGCLPDGRPYVAMELLEGLTLRAMLQEQGRIGLLRATRLVAQALDGLEAVHQAGMVHRDVKPTNMMVCARDRLKLLDFGVAKWIRGSCSGVHTSTGQVLGTARYMAPEQLRGKPVDGRADLYAAALVLFEAASGVHPFASSHGATGAVLARLRRPAPRLSELCVDAVPPALDAAVATALSADPNQRFASAGEFADALRRSVGSIHAAPRMSTVDPFATTRVQPASLTWSQLIASETKPCGAVPAHEGDTAPTRVERSPRMDRLTMLGVTSSICALILGVTAVSAAALAAAGGEARSNLRGGSAACGVMPSP